MSLIRKHAALWALLSCFALAAAAPYLIPANPDSAVFRSGTLGMMLELACFYPIYQAALHAGKRRFVSGLVFGFLFAAALSIGSELFVYDGLLRGTGSLIRRFAVPVLAAPALGSLAARLLSAREPLKIGKPLRLPVWGYALFLLLCWLPVLLAFFPGALNYDFPWQYAQRLEHSYSNLHPLLHSALSNGLVALGEALGSPTLGVLFNTLLQMTAFAFALAYSCVFVQRRGAPAWVSVLMAAAYAWMPVFSVMAISTCKDTLFSACVLVMMLQTWEMIEAPQAFFSRRRSIVLYIVCGVGSALLRNNGLFAYALLLPSLLIVLRGYRRQAALLLAACLGASAAVTGVLTAALSPEAAPSFQLYSIPAQQLVRAYNSGRMSEEEKAEIEEWYTSRSGYSTVYPHLGDSAKGYLDRARIQTDGRDFLKIWAKDAKAYAYEYLEAFLMLNVGSWYPDDLSHSTIYPDVTYSDKGYLQLQEYDMTEAGIQNYCFLPAVANQLERICRFNYYQKYPIVAILFSTATPFWLIVFACAKLVSDRRGRFLPAALGVLGLWLGYLFGPCTLPRYTLPLYCIAPALLAAAFYQKGISEPFSPVPPKN